MSESNDFPNQIVSIRNKIDKVIEMLRTDEDRYYSYFLSSYRNKDLYDYYGNSINFTRDDFPYLVEKCLEYLNKQLGFFNDVIEMLTSIDLNNEHISRLLNELIYRATQELISQIDSESIIYQYYNIIDYSLEYKSIILLRDFINTDKNIILIGGNGSGKSSFANIMKGTDEEYISVIPAQKSLYFSLSDSQLLTTRINDLKQLLLQNNIKRSKEKDDYEFLSYQNNQFTKLIVAMKEEHFIYLLHKDNNIDTVETKQSVYENFKKVFQLIFPEIDVDFDEDSREDIIMFTKKEDEFHINSLSEGEKAVIYYTISVLMATENSLIVVDEPETYLNPSLANTLWDTLIKVRDDCQFIFITHSVDFVSARNDAEIFWIKNYLYPDAWEIERINDEFHLPKNLLTEVLGSKKPVLFCEGDSKNSIDYEVYQSLLSDKYTIIPVGGHREVINYCRMLSAASGWLGVESVGIIDGDNFSREKISELIRDNIIVLPFNEIEMLLISDEIMEYTLRDIYYDNTSEKILEFKEKFWEKFEREKEMISLNKVKIEAEEFIQKQGIENFKTIDSLEQNIQEISQFDAKDYFNNFNKRLDNIYNEKNYGELLKVCNLKKGITRETANIFLDSNYERKAVNTIKNEQKLKQLLIEKYFFILTDKFV